MNRRWLPVLLALGLIVTGCGKSASGATTAPTSSRPPGPSTAQPSVVDAGHSARYAGPLTRSFSYDPPSVVFSAPKNDPAVGPHDWKRAFHDCFKPAGCIPTGAATVSLASATGISGFPSPTGKLLDHVDVFVVVWQPSTDCVTVAASTCRLVDIISMKAGGVVYAFQLDATEPPPIGGS